MTSTSAPRSSTDEPPARTTGIETRAAQEPPAASLGERERNVLSELARQGDAIIAFQGLRRRLELHQQQLTRTLRRLEDDGLVHGGDDGYQLTEAGFTLLADGQPGADTVPSGPGRCGGVPLAQALLPPHVGADAVESHLAQRWFKGLRWYGKAAGPGETSLIWMTERGQDLVKLQVAGNAFAVVAECCREPDRETYLAVHALVSAVTELYGMRPPPGATAGAQGNGQVSGLVAGDRCAM